MTRLLPRSVVGQTILVMLIGLGVSHLISMAIFSTDRVEALVLAGGRNMAERIANIGHLMDDAPAAWRPRLLAALDEPGFRLTVTADSPLPDIEADDVRGRFLRQFLETRLGGDEAGRVRVALIEDAGQAPPPVPPMGGSMMMQHMRMMHGASFDHALRVSLRLGDGQWLTVNAAIAEDLALWSPQAFYSLVLMAVAVVLFSVWVVRRLTGPLRVFAGAAERLGRDVHAPPLAETGPTEIRQAAHAFNEMQTRLKRLIANRTRMLAAISHDLRTPITLLRLRAELIEADEDRAKTLATLDEMEAMIASTLAFAREDAETEETVLVDLAALIESACDDLADAGQPVSATVPGRLPYRCRPLALKRALTNLIDNAVKYGGEARVSLAEAPESLRLTVEDRGPGIPEDVRDQVFAPFYRIEGSRNPETGGVGLGLSVAQTVVHAHGGEIALENRAGGGLRVVIDLPR